MDVNVQNAIEAAVAAALAEAAGVAHPAAEFARSPALANVGLLNYGTSEGMKISTRLPPASQPSTPETPATCTCS
jgi:hypothetical protein